MLLATTEQQIQTAALHARHGGGAKPLAGFTTPQDVLDDPAVSAGEKRAVLASWISDASAVQDEPQLRWLLGTPEPVTTGEIRAALAELDAREDAGEPPCTP